MTIAGDPSVALRVMEGKLRTANEERISHSSAVIVAVIVHRDGKRAGLVNRSIRKAKGQAKGTSQRDKAVEFLRPLMAGYIP